MFTIKQTDEFTAWIDGIKDGMTRRRLGRRLERAQAGNFGDVASVGEGVSTSDQAGACTTCSAGQC